MPVLDNTPVPWSIMVTKTTTPGERIWGVTWRAYKGSTLVQVTSVTTATDADDWTSLQSQITADMTDAYAVAGYAVP